MAKRRITSGMMADALIGGGEDAMLKPLQTTYAASILAIQKRRAAIAKHFTAATLGAVSVEAEAICEIAGDLGQLALESESGVPPSRINEVVRIAQKLISLCASLAVMPSGGDAGFAPARLEEMNALLIGLQDLAKHTP